MWFSSISCGNVAVWSWYKSLNKLSLTAPQETVYFHVSHNALAMWFMAVNKSIHLSSYLCLPVVGGSAVAYIVLLASAAGF